MIHIFADSTCDLSPALIDRYHVTILPLHIVLGEDVLDDGPGLDVDAIYRWSDEHHTTPRTAAVGVAEARAVLRKVPDGDEVIAFTISAEMSSTVQALRMAAAEAGMEDRVHVVDSRNLSTGIGLLVIEAAVLAGRGLPAADVVREIGSLIPKVRASFVVDTLEYLHRGGRCSGLSAMLGGMLHLHPRICVADGKMRPEKKYRGRMKHVVLDYAKDMEADLLSAREDRVFITHSGCPDDIVEAVHAYLTSLGRFREILVTRAGGVVSSHCGYGTLGVLFISR